MNEEKQTVDLEVQKAKSVTINNQDDYENAAEIIKRIKNLKNKLNERYLPIKKKTYEAYQLAMQNVNDYAKPLEQAERMIKDNMGRYVQKKEIERRAEENRLKREVEEKEREKLKKELEECGLNKEEAKEEAKKMEIITPEIKLEDETKIDKVSYREDWKYNIEDVDKIPREYLIPDEKKIASIVRSYKDKTNIPGVSVFCKKTAINRY